MVDASRHPNIKILSYAEVKQVEGFVGNFRVKVVQKPRYVIPDRCNGCGECATVCPIDVPNEFDLNLAPRKAIYVPLPQAVPLVYTIDMDNCIECFKCIDACGKLDAIDFSQEPQEIDFEVGTVIVSTGYDIYDPTPIKEYGYGRYQNVLTAIELERLVDASGPTVGKVIRPSDGKAPKSYALIQCVGSRDQRTNEYCSGFCCMYTIKNALVLKEKYPDAEISILYMDIRSPGKSYEEFYRRARANGIKFIRGRPSEIAEDPETKSLTIFMEDTAIGRSIRLDADMVVLSTAAVPRESAGSVSQALTVPADASGFFMEYHPKLRPIDSPTDGIFLAGSAQGPKDIPYSVAQGSGAAARAARILNAGKWEIEPVVAWVDQSRCRNTRTKCGICSERCAYNAVTSPEGEAAFVISAKCHGCGTCVADCPEDCITQHHFSDVQILSQLYTVLKDKPEEKIVAFMCHWCSYGGADMAGTSHFEYPASSRGIRVMCSGRVDRDFVLEAFRRNAGMVLVSGCHKQDCHYITGQIHAENRLMPLFKLFQQIGISPDRFRVEWISAAEGEKYARVIREMDEKLRAIGTEKIQAENAKALPFLNRMLRNLVEVPETAEEVREEVGVR